MGLTTEAQDNCQHEWHYDENNFIADCPKCSKMFPAACHPLYGTYMKMISRCENMRDKAFRNYGARGIRVCVAWKENFFQFLKDVGPKPSPEHSLDRILNDGDYEPSNCWWATRACQGTNKQRLICRLNPSDVVGVLPQILLSPDHPNQETKN
jgi:hypothetical protein